MRLTHTQCVSSVQGPNKSACPFFVPQHICPLILTHMNIISAHFHILECVSGIPVLMHMFQTERSVSQTGYVTIKSKSLKIEYQ